MKLYRSARAIVIAILLLEATLADVSGAEVTNSDRAIEVAPSLEPGTTFYLDFPRLGPTWRDVPTRAGVYLPTDYTTEKQLPLFVWFGGGAGTDNPKKPVAITEGTGFICVALPYRTEDDGKPGGWQTPWSYYETILDRLEAVVPNIDPTRRVCGGFSSGGAAVTYQIGNSDGAFQKYFYAFIPGGAGWPMGGLETIKGRPMLALMGEKDKRLPNFEVLEKEALAAGIDFKLRVFEGYGHGMPAEFHDEIRQWMVDNVVLRQVRSKD